MTTQTVWVTSSFVSFHCWPDAPAEVSYLRSLHRHTFNVKIEVKVRHEDRDVEFHILKRKLTAECRGLHELADEEQTVSQAFRHNWSCEHYCDYFWRLFTEKGYIVESVAVDEDGECGAIKRKSEAR